MNDKAKRLGAVAAIATAIAIPAEGPLRRLLPAFAVADQIDKRLGHAGNNGKRVGRYALVQQLADVYDLFAGELVRRLVLAVQINKSGFPSVLGISGNADPFKVVGPVIRLDPVDVVNTQARRVSVDKSEGDKPMNKESCPLSVNPKPNLLVSGVMRLRSYLGGFSLSSNGLRLSVTDSRVAVRSGWNSNPAFATDFKRDSALCNGFPEFHDRILTVLGVRIIGGAC